MEILYKPSFKLSTMIKFFSFLALTSLTISSFACNSDIDCDSGETCFKREKRASGICYPSIKRNPEESTELKPITGAIRDRAIEWLGDPIQIIEENFPNKTVGKTCVVSSECPTGFQCVLAGFEGRCVEF